MALSLFLEGLWYQFPRMYLWESPSSAHSGILLLSECIHCQASLPGHQKVGSTSPAFSRISPCSPVTPLLCEEGYLALGEGSSASDFCLLIKALCLQSPHTTQHTSSRQRMGGLQSSWTLTSQPPCILENWPRSPSRTSLVSFKFIPMFLFLLL